MSSVDQSECQMLIQVNVMVFVDRGMFDIGVVYRDFRKGFSEIVFFGHVGS